MKRWAGFALKAGASLAILAVIAALVVYYGFSDRYTPFTTDAYLQVYVVQVAARVEGEVTGFDASSSL